MGAVSGQRNYIKNGAVKWDVCLSKTLKVGDTIPTGMVLEEELKNYERINKFKSKR